MTGAGLVAWFGQWQVGLYLAALAVGAGVGLALPGTAAVLEGAITPLLGLLLFATFLGVPVADLPRSFRDRRFVAVVLVLNFVVVPAVVFGLTRFVADDEALLVGALLVLLTPCVDYVIVFTGLAGGAKERLLAVTPLLMLLQLVLLPGFLLLFAGREAVAAVDARPLVEAFVLLIVLPLVAAGVVQWCAGRGGAADGARASCGRAGGAARWVEETAGAAMVPLMMLTLAVVVASQVSAVGAELPALARVVPLYVAFAILLPLLAIAAARIGRLDVAGARAAVFSATTRNSLVVLPLALAVAARWPLAPIAVVTQTLVELVVMVVLVAALPRLIPAIGARNHDPRPGSAL